MPLPTLTIAQKLAMLCVILFWLTVAWERNQLPTDNEMAASALDSALVQLAPDSLSTSPKGKLTFGKSRRLRRKQRIYDESRGSAQRVLLTGDSMGDGLYLAWRKNRKKGKFDLRYAPWYGSTSEDWGTTTHLEELIADYKPTLVVFSLGSNDLLNHKVKQSGKHLREIVRQLGRTPYVWVGPPNWREDTGINDLIAKHVSKKYFFVSKDLDLERQPDGIHVTFAGSEVWADTIGQWLDRNPHYRFSLTGRRAAKGYATTSGK
jgi:hypothetical protein